MGFIVILINFVYLIFSIIVGVVTNILLKKRDIFKKRKRIVFSVIVFLTVLLAPFWDLIIQKGIKTYYETYKMDYVINAYPEKDENGRIESLGVGRGAASTTSAYLINQEDLKDLKKEYEVSNFMEYFFSSSFKKIENDKGEIKIKRNFYKDLGYARVHFDKSPISYEKISDKTEFKARYQVLAKTKKYYFYSETVTEFWDKKKNILMSKSLYIGFPVQNKKDKFRTKYLIWWINAGGGVFVLRWLDNTSEVAKELFGFDI